MSLIAMFLSALVLTATSFTPAEAIEASTSAPPAELSASTVSRAYINPFQDRTKFRIFVIGDSIANQLSGGLKREFQGESDIEIVNWARARTGFVVSRKANWADEIASLLALEHVDIAVVSFGVSDRRNIVTRGKRYPFNSKKWRELYTAQVDRFLNQLRNKNIAVYWVGLPIMRKQKFDADMRHINRLLRGRAQSRGLKFTDTWRSFSDATGKYRTFGADRNGLRRRLRAADGVHFTAHGAGKLASLVAREIKSDIIHTKAERNIELIGKQPLTTTEVTAFKATTDGLTSMEGLYEPAPEATSPIDHDQSMAAYKQEQDGVPEDPVARAERLKLIGQMQSATRSNNLTIVQPTRGRKADRVVMPAYVKVLLMGEPVKPKPGRGDDFAWPSKTSN